MIKIHELNKNWILFLLIFLISCTNESKNVRNDFGKEIKLIKTDSVNLENLEILNPINLLILDSFFVVQNRVTENNLSFIDKNCYSVFNTAIKGNGPMEIVQFIPVSNNRQNVVTFADRARKILYSLKVNDNQFLINDEIHFSNEIPRFFSLNELNDSILIGTGMFPDGRFGIFNKNKNTILYSEDYPRNNEMGNITFPHIAAVYSGTQVGINPDGKRFAAIYNGLLDIYEINSDSKLKEIKSIYYHFPKFIIPENGPLVGNSKETIEGFRSITCDSEYIYLLYSGKSMEEYDMDAFVGRRIYVYNWAGVPIKSYIVDTDLSVIFVKDKFIWGIEKNGVYINKYSIDDEL